MEKWYSAITCVGSINTLDENGGKWTVFGTLNLLVKQGEVSE